MNGIGEGWKGCPGQGTQEDSEKEGAIKMSNLETENNTFEMKGDHTFLSPSRLSLCVAS